MPRADQPSPKPSPQSDALRPASGSMRPIRDGGQPLLSDGSRQAVAYTPMPDQPAAGSRSRRWMLVAAIAAAAIAAAIGIPLAGRSSAPGGPSRPPAVAQQDEPLLIVGAHDLDREATRAAQTALASGRIPELTENPSDAERDRIGRAVAAALPDAAPAVTQRVAHVLAHATPPIRKALLNGRQGLFRLRVLDNMAEDGDVVWLGLDGVPFGDLVLRNAGTEITVALPVGTPAHLLIVATRDGGGGVTFGAASSQGELRSRVMNVGDREEWTVVVR